MFALTGASGTGVRCGLSNPGSPFATEAALVPSTLTGLTGIYESVDSTVTVLGETKGSGFLNRVNDALIHYMLFAEFGIGAQCYAYNATYGPGIARGSQSYENIPIAVRQAIALASSALNKTVVVRAATFTHGEQDGLIGTSTAQYEADILQLQQNLTSDLQAITGQSQLVALFLDQVSSWTASPYSAATSKIPQAQLNAALDNPDRIFLVCPKYFLTYYSDGIHLLALSQEILGEYYAKAYLQTIIRGVPWKPVYPIAFASDGASPTHITITFNVPVGPLVLDTTLVSDPGSKGFEYSDASGVTISSVAIQNGNQLGTHALRAGQRVEPHRALRVHRHGE